MDPVVSDPTPPTPPPPFKWQSLLPVLGLVLLLPAIVAGVKIKQLVAPRADEVGTVASVRINPGQIITLPGANPVPMSTLAFDAAGQAIDSGLTYTWGMSSTNSIGTLRVNTTNSKLAIFTPDAQNVGQGDIFVQAFGPSGSATGSIPIYAGINPPTPLPTPIVSPTPTLTPTPTPIVLPTPTPTPRSKSTPPASAIPSPLPTPTPTPITNFPPIFLTTSLPNGSFWTPYSTLISGFDQNSSDTLTMRVTQAPLGTKLSNCSQTVAGGRQITCKLSWFPYWSGTYSLTLELNDNRGGRATTTYSLIIL